MSAFLPIDLWVFWLLIHSKELNILFNLFLFSLFSGNPICLDERI